MQFLDRHLANREYLASDRYTMADIALLTIIDFAAFIEVPIPEDLANLKAWHDRVSARPSAAA